MAPGTGRQSRGSASRAPKAYRPPVAFERGRVTLSWTRGSGRSSRGPDPLREYIILSIAASLARQPIGDGVLKMTLVEGCREGCPQDEGGSAARPFCVVP